MTSCRRAPAAGNEGVCAVHLPQDSAGPCTADARHAGRRRAAAARGPREDIRHFGGRRTERRNVVATAQVSALHDLFTNFHTLAVAFSGWPASMVSLPRERRRAVTPPLTIRWTVAPARSRDPVPFSLVGVPRAWKRMLPPNRHNARADVVGEARHEPLRDVGRGVVHDCTGVHWVPGRAAGVVVLVRVAQHVAELMSRASPGCQLYPMSSHCCVPGPLSLRPMRSSSLLAFRWGSAPGSG